MYLQSVNILILEVIKDWEPCAVGFARFRELDGVKVFCGGLVPIHCVPLVDRVNTTFLGDAHLRSDFTGRGWYVRVSQNEFSEGIVEGKPIDAIAGRKHQVGTRSIHTYNERHSLEGEQYPAQTISVPALRT